MKPYILKLQERLLIVVAVAMIVFGCSSGAGNSNQSDSKASEAPPVSENGVGPVHHLDVPSEIDEALAEKGKAIFNSKCSACHKFEERYVGPALSKVTERRNPAWIMNMIMNPSEMTQKDPIAKKLLAEYLTQMADQNVSEGEARAILEFFRSEDKQ